MPVITTPNPTAARVVEEHRCGIVVGFDDLDGVLGVVTEARGGSAVAALTFYGARVRGRGRGTTSWYGVLLQQESIRAFPQLLAGFGTLRAEIADKMRKPGGLTWKTTHKPGGFMCGYGIVPRA